MKLPYGFRRLIGLDKPNNYYRIVSSYSGSIFLINQIICYLVILFTCLPGEFKQNLFFIVLKIEYLY